MKLQKFLDEAYLMSQYKFGFELEAILQDVRQTMEVEYICPQCNYRLFDNPNESRICPECYGDEEIEMEEGRNDEELDLSYHQPLINFFNTYFQDGEIGSDSSIRVEEDEDESFEYKSPPLNFTPKNLNLFIHLLSNCKHHKIYTNDSCSLHTHISFPDLNEESMKWVLLNLSVDNKMRFKISRLKIYDFVNKNYADDDYLDQIKDELNDFDFNFLNKSLKTNKYTLLNLHGQGTLEWRGPRGFLDLGILSDIKDFVKLLHEFIKWIDNVLDKKVINLEDGKKFERKQLTTFEKNILPSDFGKKINYEGKFSNVQDKEEIYKIYKNFPWLKNCKFQQAKMKIEKNKILIFENGYWNDGVWLGEIWNSGVFFKGVFKGKNWNGGIFKGGVFKGENWNDGSFNGNGIWMGKNWNDGYWYNGKIIVTLEKKRYLINITVDPIEFNEILKVKEIKTIKEIEEYLDDYIRGKPEIYKGEYDKL